MPPFTALLHTHNDALRLGRALETLFAGSEILIVDHHSKDATRRVAREYGARVVEADENGEPKDYARLASHEWILCLQANESIHEGLQASLYEWRSQASAAAPVFSMFVREETPQGWVHLPAPETRLIPRTWDRWNGRLPARESEAIALDGELLRFAFA